MFSLPNLGSAGSRAKLQALRTMPNISRELRKQRRAAERKAQKLAHKQESTSVPVEHPTKTKPLAAAAPNTERNRQNAQHSTGPRTQAGKTASSRNAFRHGLASNTFFVLSSESYDDFLELLQNLCAEHQPQTQTEALLVEKMAQHFWLAQRALRLQDLCFQTEVPICDQPKELALYLRYQTTNDRAFHKCLSTLRQLQKERGFVPQQHEIEVAERPESSNTAPQSGTSAVLPKSANACGSFGFVPQNQKQPLSLRPDELMSFMQAQSSETDFLAVPRHRSAA